MRTTAATERSAQDELPGDGTNDFAGITPDRDFGPAAHIKGSGRITEQPARRGYALGPAAALSVHVPTLPRTLQGGCRKPAARKRPEMCLFSTPAFGTVNNQ